MKIEKLTPEQESAIPSFVTKWVEKALSTVPVSDEEITKIILDFNKHILCDKEKPVQIYDSPIMAWKAVCQHVSTDKNNPIKLDFIYPYADGMFSCSYFAWIDYMQFIGVENIPSQTKFLMETHKVGFIFPLDDVIIVCRKPSKIFKNANGLHCENGPALQYANDPSCDIYALNGVIMSKEQVMTPAEKLSAKDVLSERNAEVRRELIRKMGIEVLLNHLSHRVLDKQNDYELLSVALSDEVTDAKYLKMINPSIGTFHVEAVDENCKTVQSALNWRAQQIIAANEQWQPSILT